MIKLNKKETKAFAIRYFWSWYIYWIPTIMTEYHHKDISVLTNISIGDTYDGEGNNFCININIFIWSIDIDFWWNLTKKEYAKRY